ncbi:hypothetical protein, conserved [Eimeria maxima]|uniref:Uncharacterized protein n=1 Tax=Eimeria maxima TaxID=5804 RepID=U6M005_EIMMA|nr:hypothetical protein, conserved [Eimeria maxima]CDJ57341.1 hypothetical protein, conserved [Eimeria maxima]
MRIKRQTAEAAAWQDTPLLLQQIGAAAARDAPLQLQRAVRQQQLMQLQQQQPQQQQQQQQQRGRLSSDQWIAAAMRAYGRGLRDIEAAAWFTDAAAADLLPQQLAAALQLKSFLGFSYLSQVFAVYDDSAAAAAAAAAGEEEEGIGVEGLGFRGLKVLAHELGHAFKELLQETPVHFTKERPLDFDETFAVLAELVTHS